MSRKILGLDIREKSLSAVLINGTLQGNQIEACAFIDFSGDKPDGGAAVDNPPVSPEELLGTMLARVTEKMVIDDATCIVSLPAFLISFRNIQVPFRNEKKIKQIINFELEPVMPGSVDDLVVDFKMLESPGDDGETVLVTASAERALIDSFESCLQKNGFEAQAVVPGGSAAAEFLIRTDDLTDYLFIDADEENGTLFLIKEKEIVFIRSLGVSASLDLDIRRTVLSYCEQYDVDYDPETVYVSGPFFQNDGMVEELSEKTGKSVVKTDVCESAGFIMEDDLKNGWEPALFDNALALTYNATYGLTGLRFSERFFAVGKYVSEYKKELMTAGILLCLVIIAGLGNIGLSAYTLNQKVAEAKAQMDSVYREAFPNAKVIRDAYTQMKGKVNEARKNAAFQDKSAGNVRVVDMLNDISKNIPDALEVEFNRFVLGSEGLKIDGDAATYSNVDMIKKELEKIDYFKKVVISSTTNNKTGQGVRFKLKIEM